MTSVILPTSGTQVEVKDHVNLKMKELRAWMDAERSADLKAQYAFIAPCIQSWDFDLDPANPDSLDELDMIDFFALSRAISSVIRRTQAEKN